MGWGVLFKQLILGCITEAHRVSRLTGGTAKPDPCGQTQDPGNRGLEGQPPLPGGPGRLWPGKGRLLAAPPQCPETGRMEPPPTDATGEERDQSGRRGNRDLV